MKWYDKYDIPIRSEPIIIYTESKKMMVIKNPCESSWKWLVEKHKIKNWIFCDEIKPMNET